MKRTTRIVGALAALSLAVAGAVGPAMAGDKEGICWPGENLGQCSGDLGNGLGKYEVRLPADFNGTVIMYFHGVRFGKNTPVLASLKAAGIDYSNDPAYDTVNIPGMGAAWVANGKVEVGSSASAVKDLMAKGYGVAGLGYGDTQGWAVREAYEGGKALIAKLRSGYVYGLKKVIVSGTSMGTLATLSLAENVPGISAAYAACNVPPSTQLAFQQALDALFVLKTLGGLDLKLTYSAGQAGLGEAYTDLNKVLGLLGAIKADANYVTPTKLLGRNVVLMAGLLAGLPEASANYDGITTGGPLLASQLNTGAAMMENIGQAAVFGTLLRFDIESRLRVAGGIATGSANFTDNVNTSYASLLSDEQRAQYETFLNLGGTNVVDIMLGALDASKGTAARVAANATAVATAKALFPEYSGVAKIPTMLVGYEVDPVTQAGQAQRYVDRTLAVPTAVTKKDKLPLAVAVYAAAPLDGWTVLGDAAKTAAKRTSGIGHCGQYSSLTSAQTVALLPALDTWIKRGAKLGYEAIDAARNDAALGLQSDPDWAPVEVKY